MRVMKIFGTTLGVSAAQEARWPLLAAEAVNAVQEGKRPVPTVWFQTEARVVGSLPVSDRVAVSFADEEDPVGFLGSVTLLGPEAGPPAAGMPPDEGSPYGTPITVP